MDIVSYLRSKVGEPWEVDEINEYEMRVSPILQEFYFQARRGLAPGIPMFETRFPDGRYKALIEGLEVNSLIIGANHEEIMNTGNKAKLLKMLEEMTIVAHSRRRVNLTGYGRHRDVGENMTSDFRKTQKRNVQDFWKKK